MNWDSFINYEILELGSFKLLTGNLLIGIIVAFFTWLVVYMLKRAILRPRFIIDKIDSKRRMSFYLIAKYVVWFIGVVSILEIIGVDIKVILLGSTALLVGLGLGLQNIFKDLVSGLFLLFEGTIKIGDVIETEGIIGRVTEINLRNSQMRTREDVTIIIPNSKFVVEKVTNWSHDGEQVRFIVNVSVAYGSDLDVVFNCLEEAMLENTKVLRTPAPFVRFTNFGESALEFEMIFWSKETFVINQVKSDLRRAVYAKLKANGLAIPFPQRDIHIKGMEHMVDFKGKQTTN